MGTMATVRVNTTQKMILYRDFIIQGGYDTVSKSNVWEWTHEDFATNGITGDCQTVFEAIEAVDAWHEQAGMEAAE